MASFVEQTLQTVQQLVDEEFKATQAYIFSEIQPLSWDELQKLAFNKSLESVKKLEEQAGLG